VSPAHHRRYHHECAFHAYFPGKPGKKLELTTQQNSRGNAYADLNQPDQAIADFTQAIKLDRTYCQSVL
jgi:hypothetical protein